MRDLLYSKTDKVGQACGKHVVCHLCDTKRCCNPEHLEFDTRRQNALDCLPYRKSCKFNEVLIREIKTLLKAEPALTHSQVASQYHVARSTISAIKSGDIWSHVTI